MAEDVQDTTEATTQSDLFNPDQSGAAVFGGGPEPLSCDGLTYGKTVWYDLHPRIPGGVELIASGFTTAINLYEYNAQTLKIIRSVGCQFSTSPVNDFAFGQDLQAGKAYTVQIGGLQTPSGFDSGHLDFSVWFFPDHDGDGVVDAQPDACPLLPGVPQFAGCPPTLHPTARITYTFLGSGLRIRVLQVDNVPGGARVEARCRRCGLRQVRYLRPHASSVAMTAFQRRTLPFGAKLEIWMTKSHTGTGIYKYGAIGSYFSYTVTPAGLSSRVTRCLMPGSLTPKRDCSGGRLSHASELARRATVPAADGGSRFAIDAFARFPGAGSQP